MLGAEMFGDGGLMVAAEAAFRDALTGPRRCLALPHAEIGLLTLKGRRALAAGDAQAARIAAARFAQPIATLKEMSRRIRTARMLSVDGHILRAELLCDWGTRLEDAPLLRAAARDTHTAASGLTPDFEPLTIARIGFARARAQIALGDVEANAEAILGGVDLIYVILADLSLEHSPLDRTRGEYIAGCGLKALGDISGDARYFERALTAFDRAAGVIAQREGLVLRAEIGSRRAVCLARVAEISGDVNALKSAEKALKQELANPWTVRNPHSWARLQLFLARLLLARLEITRRDRGERAGARSALSSAVDALSEDGLRALGRSARQTLERVSTAMSEPAAKPEPPPKAG
jgi:hypothetical protein